MAPKKSSGKDLYSYARAAPRLRVQIPFFFLLMKLLRRVILPTFNERQNLPIVTWLLNRTFTER